jgi:hypothetical protein
MQQQQGGHHFKPEQGAKSGIRLQGSDGTLTIVGLNPEGVAADVLSTRNRANGCQLRQRRIALVLRDARPRHRALASTCCPEPRLCRLQLAEVSDARHGPPEVAVHRAQPIEPAATSCRAALVASSPRHTTVGGAASRAARKARDWTRSAATYVHAMSMLSTIVAIAAFAPPAARTSPHAARSVVQPLRAAQPLCKVWDPDDKVIYVGTAQPLTPTPAIPPVTHPAIPPAARQPHRELHRQPQRIAHQSPMPPAAPPAQRSPHVPSSRHLMCA